MQNGKVNHISTNVKHRKTKANSEENDKDELSSSTTSSADPPKNVALSQVHKTSVNKTLFVDDGPPYDIRLFRCMEGKVAHFDKLASNSRKKALRQYYERQADLLRSVQEDRRFVQRVVEKSGAVGSEQVVDARLLTAEKGTVRRCFDARLMIMASLCVNVTLTAVKCAASLLSGSLAIISSLIDSTLDLVSGVVTWYTVREIRKRDPYLYPRGCTRMEPLGSVIVSVIMGVANVQIISKSFEAIFYDKINIDVRLPTVLMMVVTVLCKFVLYVLCKLTKSPSLAVLTLDHRNDCISNSVAILCAYLAYYHHDLRFLDPLGAILVSSYICVTWFFSGRQHMRILSGRAAKPEFYCRILHVALDHLPSHVLQIETLKVYHMGTQFLVELHIVLDRDMPMHQAHDISESLQRKIEHLPYVERAFVHVDHDITHSPDEEHKDV